jgi:formylglycine-generating enzyme required for sulfatase activity
MNHTHRTSLTPISLLTGMAILALAPWGRAQEDQTRRIEVSFKKVDIESAYVKCPTWQDTLRASIDKMRNEHPTFALGNCSLNEQWFRNGLHAVPPGKRATEVDFKVALTKLDLGAKKPDGSRVWEYEGPVAAGQPYDLKLPARSSLFQCRQFEADAAGPLDMVLGSDVPLTMWHNGEKIHEVKSGATELWNPKLLTLKVQKGRNEIMIRFDNEGTAPTTRFFISFNNITTQWNPLVEQLQKKVAKDFTSPLDVYQQRVDFDARIWLSPWNATDEQAASKELALRYARVIARPEYRDALVGAANAAKNAADVLAVRAACYNVKWFDSLGFRLDFEALRRAIADKQKNPAVMKPAVAKTFLDRVDQFERAITSIMEANLGCRKLAGFTIANAQATKPMTRETFEKFSLLVDQWSALQRDVLLVNPAIDFDRVLLLKRPKGNLGLPENWLGGGAMSGDLDDELVTLQWRDPQAELVSAFKPEGGRKSIADVDLNWDGRRALYSSISRETGTWQVFEIALDPAAGKALGAPRQLTPKMGEGVKNYDACYLPDDRILFCSTAVKQGVPCLAGADEIANLYQLSKDGTAVRQLCFDQDHNWNPTVMNDGRVLYLRWEYMDTPHYFTRLLFRMNPDGTGQTSYYKSNLYWPNSIFFARPIPGHPTKVVGIASGHHGVPRMGELVIFDPAQGDREMEGVVQRIPGYGKKVERVLADSLVNSSWPKFLHPYPIDEGNFLVAAQLSEGSNWGLYLVDVFDNMLLLKESNEFVLFEPLPFRASKKPPAIPDRVNLARKDATVYIQNVYTGPGLTGVPRGSIDRIRLLELHFNYSGKDTGGYINAAVEGGWEPKRILGTVPVEKDGSAMFRVPANTPLILQPLDRQGRAYQIMRSWLTAMPGESVSCIGCHESRGSSVAPRLSLASNKTPAPIEPWYGLTRGFDFVRELQPVLDAKCVKCHDGSKDGRPNLADKKHGFHEFYNSYQALHPYVRRPGPEGDYHILKPLEYHASTSELVQMLEKGHHDVKLSAEEWDRLVTWIDMNVPCFGTWSDRMGREAVAKQHAERADLRQRYAAITDDPESPLGDPTAPFNVEFLARGSLKRTNPPALPPAPRPALAAKEKLPAQVDGWPFKVPPPKDRLAVELPNKIKLELVGIPAGAFVMGADDGFIDEGPRRLVRIDKPFDMATVETSNEMYALFDPAHDTRFIDLPGMSLTSEGMPVNGPRQPVARVTWNEAVAFCKWLSNKTGDTYALPTEEQWEWACRAGTDTPFFYGDINTDFSKFANFADTSIIALSVNQYGRPQLEDFNLRDRRFDDKYCVTANVGSYQPNPFGLFDMHGNVSEWTLSDYGKCGGGYERKVVRGGSWADRPKKARASWRWGYYPFQPVFDVGFRVVRLTSQNPQT